MANAVTTARIQAIVEGLDQVEGLKGALKQLSQTTSPASENIDKLKRAAIALGDASSASTRDLRSAASVLRELKDVTQIASKEYNDLARSLQGVESRLNAATSASRSFAQAQAQAARNPFAASGAGRTRGATQYSEAIGPKQLDYGAVNQGLDQLKGSLDQYEQLQRNSRIRQLETNSKFNALELDQQNKAAAQQLRAQQQSFEAELRDFDTRLNNRVKQRQQRKDRFKNFGQTAGAIAASGVFGGPEGAIGAGIGAAIGGPAGALGGGAIGAQVGMLRQQLGGFATYAADIEKLQIALRGVTKTQSEYEAAVRAAAAVTKDFNVPQLEATQGMTQLSAAVIGAGGKVADAEVVFRNVTAAIKATGGSSEDVQGAITALSQIFSKGKVSAEELQGQLGERLPGAVTMFAKATGRTLPQLQKDLEQGVVGLADLMKFVVGPDGLGQFEQGALRVASSSADAGARLVTTWNQTKQAIGQAIAPLGAQIQDSLGRLLKELTPSLIGLAKGLAAAIKLIVDNFGAIGNIVKFATTVAGVRLAIIALTQSGPALTAFFTSLRTGFTTAGTQAIAAQGKIAAFGRSVGVLARSLAAPIVISLAIVGADIVIGLLRKVKEEKDKLQQARNEARGEDWFKQSGGLARSQQDRAKDASDAFKTLNYADKRLKQLRQEDTTMLVASQVKARNLEIQRLEQQRITANSRIRAVTDNYNKSASPDLGLTNFAQPTPTGGAGKDKVDKAAKAADDLAAQQRRLDEETAKAQIELDNDRFRYAQELIRKQYEYEQELQRKSRDNWVKSQTGAARTAAGIISTYFGELEDLQGRILSGKETLEQARQQASSAARMAAVTSAGVGTAAPTNSNAVSRLFAAANSKLGLFAGQTERCADAIRELFKVAGIAIGTTKKAWDGLSSGASLASSFFGSDIGQRINKKEDLRPGDLVGFDRTYGSWGKGVQTHVGMYAGEGMMYDHSSRRGLTKRPLDTFAGKFLYGVRPNALAGGNPAQNAQQRRAVKAEGKAGEGDLAVTAAQQQLTLTEENYKKLKEQIGEGFVLDFTSQIKDQVGTLKDSNQELELRAQLQEMNMRPEFIEAEMQKSQAFENYSKQINTASDALQMLEDKGEGNSDQANRLRTAIQELINLFPSLDAAIEKNAEIQAKAADKAKSFSTNFKESIQGYYDQVSNLGASVGNAVTSTFKGLEDQLVSFVTTGKANFTELAKSILADIARIAVQQAIIKPLLKGIGSLFGGGLVGSANGNVFAQGGLQPYAMGAAFGDGTTKFANGGIVTRPTMFKFANGGQMQNGVMGEAGPEAIMPLQRGTDGKLGVKAILNNAMTRYGKPPGTNSAIGEAGSSDPEAMSKEGTSSGIVDVRYTVERINSVDYVTADQFQQGMMRAAQQGAKQGEQNVLRKMQQSPSVRRRVGMN